MNVCSNIYVLHFLITKLDIFALISPSDIVSINQQTYTENYLSVWRQTHYDVTDKNNNISYESLNIHYH
jgi:hypothetical protein